MASWSQLDALRLLARDSISNRFRDLVPSIRAKPFTHVSYCGYQAVGFGGINSTNHVASVIVNANHSVL
jgi:hypothetical protein